MLLYDNFAYLELGFLYYVKQKISKLPHKPSTIEISEEKWIEAKHIIKNGIIKKISAAKQNIEIDIDIAAGIYIYALEEFGKLLFLKECKNVDGRYIITYRDEFLDHGVKFTKAFDYLQDNDSSECIVLNNDGGFSANSFSWKSFTIGLLPQTKARLGIFYVDFIKSGDEYDITKIPNVDRNKLNYALNKFEKVINTIE